ncbi:MAG: DUF1467 family protein [Paracoccaceae bacterium]|nr:DUF1467 family protein [Paracoccaceae bacterium]MDE2914224.1 DUF1467 family protein [Paracoccaceae bacterium]
MSLAGALVLFFVIWFMMLFVVLPQRIRTQEEDGHVTAGTPESAPVNPMLARKAKQVTLLTLIIWIPTCLVIASGWFTPDDLNLFLKLGAPVAGDGY